MGVDQWHNKHTGQAKRMMKFFYWLQINVSYELGIHGHGLCLHFSSVRNVPPIYLKGDMNKLFKWEGQNLILGSQRVGDGPQEVKKGRKGS